MGPLTGLKFIEMAGMGPAPFCGMLLAYLGAEVVTINDVEQPAPAPRFSRSEASIAHGPKHAGIDTDAVLRECGYSDEDLGVLREQGVLT